MTQPFSIERTFTIAPAPATIWKGVCDAAACAELIQHFKDTHDPEIHETYRDMRSVNRSAALSACDPPASYVDGLNQFARVVCARFAMPVTGVSFILGRYQAGARQAWHMDANPDIDRQGAHRVASYSMLLSQPGEDFEGGELEFAEGVADFGRGDLAGFTARTRHQVRPVLSGERFVVIAFAEYRDTFAKFRDDEGVAA